MSAFYLIITEEKCQLPYADSIVENRFHAIEKLSEAGSDISCTHCDRAVLGYQREVPITMGAWIFIHLIVSRSFDFRGGFRRFLRLLSTILRGVSCPEHILSCPEHGFFNNFLLEVRNVQVQLSLMRENYVVRAPIQPLRHIKRQAFKIVKTRPFFSLLSPHQSLVLLIKVINRLGSKPFFFLWRRFPNHHTTQQRLSAWNASTTRGVNTTKVGR